MIESQQPTTSFTPPTQPLTVAVKAPVGSMPTGNGFGGLSQAPKEPRKIFGIDMRSALTVIGLVAFFILAMVGVLIALRQRTAPGDVSAPNAPLSEPQAAEDKKGSCSVSFTVESTTDRLTCNSVCSATTECTAINPDFTCFKAQDTNTGFCRLTANPANTECKAATTSACQGACTADTDCTESNHTCFDTGAGKVCRLAANPTNLECKPATVTSACQEACTTNADCADSNHLCFDTGSSKVCRLAANPTNLECKAATTTAACQEACTTDTPCADSNHTCFNTGNGNVCRLASNTGSTTCSPATGGGTVGCQATCVSNADCTSPAHICYATDTGSVCRLETNPTSTTCRAAIADGGGTETGTRTTTTTTETAKGGTVAVGQPELPAELPQTGAGDIVKWLGPGIGALVLGALLLFFL